MAWNGRNGTKISLPNLRHRSEMSTGRRQINIKGECSKATGRLEVKDKPTKNLNKIYSAGQQDQFAPSMEVKSSIS